MQLGLANSPSELAYLRRVFNFLTRIEQTLYLYFLFADDEFPTGKPIRRALCFLPLLGIHRQRRESTSRGSVLFLLRN
jgi:hypothetical protein